MARLVVEVLDANDLMPKDGHGSASPFVEIEFEGQRKRTSTKNKSLNPSWNEKLVFNFRNPATLSSQIIEVFVYNDNKRSHHKNFFRKVRLYPLDKRGIFSHVKCDISLKVHALHGGATVEDVADDVEKENHHRHPRR